MDGALILHAFSTLPKSKLNKFEDFQILMNSTYEFFFKLITLKIICPYMNIVEIKRKPWLIEKSLLMLTQKITITILTNRILIMIYQRISITMLTYRILIIIFRHIWRSWLKVAHVEDELQATISVDFPFVVKRQRIANFA